MKKGPRVIARQHRNFPQQTRTDFVCLLQNKGPDPVVDCTHRTLLPIFNKIAISVQKKKLFDQCGQAKTLWSMFLPEKSNQKFCSHPQKSTAWFCREPGCNFWAYEPRNWTKKSQQNLLGKQQGEFLQKNISLHGIANDRFFFIKRKPGKCIAASH